MNHTTGRGQPARPSLDRTLGRHAWNGEQSGAGTAVEQHRDLIADQDVESDAPAKPDLDATGMAIEAAAVTGTRD